MVISWAGPPTTTGDHQEQKVITLGSSWSNYSWVGGPNPRLGRLGGQGGFTGSAAVGAQPSIPAHHAAPTVFWHAVCESLDIKLNALSSSAPTPKPSTLNRKKRLPGGVLRQKHLLCCSRRLECPGFYWPEDARPGIPHH